MRLRSEIRAQLRAYQRRLQLGDQLPTLTMVAQRAHLHRDTLYQAINGEPLADHTWHRLNNILAELEPIVAASPSRIMAVQITKDGPGLRFGLGKPIFTKR